MNALINVKSHNVTFPQCNMPYIGTAIPLISEVKRQQTILLFLLSPCRWWSIGFAVDRLVRTVFHVLSTMLYGLLHGKG